MTNQDSKDDEVFPKLVRLLGRTTEDADVRSFLTGLKSWPFKPLGKEEFTRHLEFKDRGLCLLFQAASATRHAPPNVPPMTPVLTGAYFYAQGAEGYRQFKGALPSGIGFADSPETLMKKLGPPKMRIPNDAEEPLKAYRWSIEGRHLNAELAGETGVSCFYLGF